MESDAQLKKWLKDMLQNRGLSETDGRWLYAYRITYNEYHDLRRKLKDALSSPAVRSQAHRNRYFSALFVMYSAEWWRRDYDGGAWRWDPILSSLELQMDEFAPNVRTEIVVNGIAFWGHRPTSKEGKKYFGAVVAQGGLPLKLIGQGGSNLSALMGVVLRQAARFGWSENQIVEAVTEHEKTLPLSLRHEEMYRLLAAMVISTLALKTRHELGLSADPVKQLDEKEPDWREAYPLQIDDSAAAQLLASLVRAASQVGVGKQSCIVFQVVRSLICSDNGEWSLESKIVHPTTTSADALMQQFQAASSVEVPRYFEIDVAAPHRRAFASGRLLLGSTTPTVTFSAQRYRCYGLDACEEHLLFMRSGGRELIEGGICLPGGNGLLDSDAPWVFVEEGANYRLAGVGALRVSDGTALLAVRAGCVVEPLENRGPRPEQQGLLRLDSERVIELWRIQTNVKVSSGADTWNVRIAQAQVQPRGVILEGKRVVYPMRPWPAFRGKPNVVRYDDESGRVVLSKGLRWLALGTNHSIDPLQYRGPVELQVFENEERVCQFRFLLLAAQSNESFQSGTSEETVHIEFSGWECSDVAIETDKNVVSTVEKSAGKHRVQLRSHSTPPKNVLMHMHWAGCPRDVQIWIPFPMSGGRAFDENDNPVPTGTTLSLRQAAGVRILIFDQHPDRPKKYEIELELRGDVALERSGSAPSRRRISIAKGFGEARLLDLHPEIEALLTQSNELDARVELRLMAGSVKCYSIRVQRYAFALRPTTTGLTLSTSDMKRAGLDDLAGCAVRALPLLRPTEAPRDLIPDTSEGVHCGTWSTECLEAERAPWLIYPALGSRLDFRPMCIGGYKYNEPPRTKRDVEVCQLATAIQEAEFEKRIVGIDAALVAMSDDFSHDSWAMLDGLLTAFGELPLCSIDAFKILATRPEVVVAMILRSDLPTSQLCKHVRQLKQQLGLTLELVGITVWRQVIRRFANYWQQKVGDESARLIIQMILKDRLNLLASEVPAMQINAEWLAFEWLKEFPPGLLQLQKDTRADPLHHLKRLWQGEDSLLQSILLRVHADDAIWPEARFFTDKAFVHFAELVEAVPMLQRQGPLIRNFFCLRHRDFKLSVVNTPVLCALWCTLDLPLDWWRTPVNRLALQRLRAFDPLWFDDAYRLAFAACIANELVRPHAASLPGDPTVNENPPRAYLVPAGTGQRLRERTN